MTTKSVRVDLSGQQFEFLKLAAAEVRSKPEDLLVALAFAYMNMDVEAAVSDWVANLRGYVDERRVPSVEIDEINQYGCGGRIAVEVPHA